jgi:hypothetical protein
MKGSYSPTKKAGLIAAAAIYLSLMAVAIFGLKT